MPDETVKTQELPPDALDRSQFAWSRSDETKEALLVMLSHHPPSMYGHCLRVSFHGHSLYLCGRCTGIYGGMGLGILTILFGHISLEPSWLWFLLAVALGLTTVIEWMTQRMTPRKTTLHLRFVSGLMSGIGLAIVFMLSNMFYMLVTLAIMGVSIGTVSLFEARKGNARAEDEEVEDDS
ncbi:MAG: DUF2085 domain-containing protein [Candidatus Thorarchaeota archaeon]|nr:DUF2085 domain-containing protein [Candidatus Thorarchaeota archaeon]